MAKLKTDLDQKALVALMREQVVMVLRDSLRLPPGKRVELRSVALSLEVLEADIERKDKEGCWVSYGDGRVVCNNLLPGMKGASE